MCRLWIIGMRLWRRSNLSHRFPQMRGDNADKEIYRRTLLQKSSMTIFVESHSVGIYRLDTEILRVYRLPTVRATPFLLNGLNLLLDSASSLLFNVNQENFVGIANLRSPYKI